ncbi:MAG TPA: Sec-independent protein translocase protein TatB [Burkholderiaceae bacterium]|nr:Sec-independent protein translocase protein TatB [Burkholderiaceae bacterium]
MFDVSFTELMLIGVVALVVIGPERLPKVARTVGHLLGRAQRYVSDVKSDIQREIDLDEMNKLKKQMDEAAHSLQASMRETSESFQKPLSDARKSLEEASASVEGLVEQARQEVDSSPATSAANAEPGSTAPATSAASETTPATEAAAIQNATADAAPVTAEDSGTRK